MSQESSNALFRQFVSAISAPDCTSLFTIVAPNISIDIPGASFVDLTASAHGAEALCAWASQVHKECGKTTFVIHRYFENGCELMANGEIRIERHPRTFSSPCSFHVLIEAGKITAFQLLLDTYALQKFRGEMD